MHKDVQCIIITSMHTYISDQCSLLNVYLYLAGGLDMRPEPVT